MNRQEISFDMGKRLKELREKMGLSYQGLADELFDKYEIQISKDSLRDYEISTEFRTKAKKLPNMGMRAEYLYVLADFYGVSMDYIAGRSEMKATDEEIKALVTQTGLSEQCIETLKIIHDVDTAARPEGKVKYEFVEAINCLVENEPDYNPLVWIGRYLSVPQISSENYYVSKSGEIKRKTAGVPHGKDEFLQIDRYVIESALLQQVTAELVLLKTKLNSDEFQQDLQKWTEENK